MSNPIDDYIAAAPEAARPHLRELAALIRELVPGAGEKISYRVPTWTLRGMLVHIGGFAHHVSLYPGAAGVAFAEDRLGPYQHAKGTIQFPLDQPLPRDLVTDIVLFRAEQNRAGRKGRA